jgi:hypothetical protein
LKKQFNIYFLLCREHSGPLTAFLSSIGSYELLKNQFIWLADGDVSYLIHQNLRPELGKLEMFLR